MINSVEITTKNSTCFLSCYDSRRLCSLISYRNKGVKVELGIPPELWDAPSAEVTDMQRKVHR